MYSVRLRLVRMMETEEETVNQFKHLMEPDEQEEEVEQLEEMRLPVLTSWMGPDGITVPGIMCVDDGIIRLMNHRSQFIDCSICLEPASSAHGGGKHRICCLPCGHMYGLSCIKKWLLQSSSTRKCPQCNTSCSFEDTILLYPPSLSVTHHQLASSSLSTAFFPFTKQGARAFKKYEISRTHDVRLLKHNDKIRMDILLTRANELEGVTRSLQRLASPLKPRFDALKRRTDALKRLASALRQRIDALGQRGDAFETRVKFYLQMYKEHHKKKWLAVRAAAKAKKKGGKAAEKKHKDKEKSNRGTGLNSISKGILKRKKSNNYMYYYAAGAAAVLTVPFAVGYTLYV